jgi:hypothetical protein
LKSSPRDLGVAVMVSLAKSFIGKSVSAQP